MWQWPPVSIPDVLHSIYLFKQKKKKKRLKNNEVNLFEVSYDVIFCLFVCFWYH